MLNKPKGLTTFIVRLHVRISKAQETLAWFYSGNNKVSVCTYTKHINYLKSGQDCAVAVLEKGDTLLGVTEFYETV